MVCCRLRVVVSQQRDLRDISYLQLTNYYQFLSILLKKILKSSQLLIMKLLTYCESCQLQDWNYDVPYHSMIKIELNESRWTVYRRIYNNSIILSISIIFFVFIYSIFVIFALVLLMINRIAFFRSNEMKSPLNFFRRFFFFGRKCWFVINIFKKIATSEHEFLQFVETKVVLNIRGFLFFFCLFHVGVYIKQDDLNIVLVFNFFLLRNTWV